MTNDEREALAHSVENMMGYSGGKPISGRKLAAQLRADGERIKALEAALTEVSDKLRREEERLNRIDATLTKFAARQEQLGPEFEAAINADREGLYEE